MRGQLVAQAKVGTPFYTKGKNDRILFVIAHMVPPEQQKDPDKLSRLVATLEAIKESCALYTVQVILLSQKGYSIADRLPDYLKDGIQTRFSDKEDPMKVEYDAFDVFKSQRELFDFYVFMEDDIILNDAWFFEKIKAFNAGAEDPHLVLHPHRYEYAAGKKHYFDLNPMTEEKRKPYSYDKDTLVKTREGVALCVYDNPHAAFYCLNARQLDLWVRSGYTWKDQLVAYGPLESAATFAMLENFTFLQPSPEYLGYLEIKHWGHKYIDKIKYPL